MLKGKDLDAQEKIVALTMFSLAIQLKFNQIDYYAGKPTISDAEFDKKFRALQQLEDKFPHFVQYVSPTTIVGH